MRSGHTTIHRPHPWSVQRDFLAGETLFHLHHVGFFDVQLARNFLHFRRRKRAEVRLHAAQIEEQFALRLVVANFTMRQFFRMYSWISALIQCTAKDTSRGRHGPDRSASRPSSNRCCLWIRIGMRQAVAAVISAMETTKRSGKHHFGSSLRSPRVFRGNVQFVLALGREHRITVDRRDVISIVETDSTGNCIEAADMTFSFQVAPFNRVKPFSTWPMECQQMESSSVFSSQTEMQIYDRTGR